MSLPSHLVICLLKSFVLFFFRCKTFFYCTLLLFRSNLPTLLACRQIFGLFVRRTSERECTARCAALLALKTPCTFPYVFNIQTLTKERKKYKRWFITFVVVFCDFDYYSWNAWHLQTHHNFGFRCFISLL